MAQMTKKERERLLARAAKLKPKPVLLPSGSWRCQILIDGKRKSVTADTPEAAHAQALALREGFIEQKDSMSSEAITLHDAITVYIQKLDNILATSTINGYYEIQRNRFKKIMEKRVSDISIDDLQEAINEDSKNVSNKTIKNALGVIVPVIKKYKKFDADKIKMPPKIKKEKEVMQVEDLIKLFDAIKGDITELPILFAVWLGMRRSEIMGLCWDCIDFEKQEVHIKRTYVKDKKKGFVLVERTKVPESRRKLSCPNYILERLKNYTPNRRNGRIFTMHPNTIYKNMNKICKKNGINFVGVHGLRRTNASIMHSLNIVDKVAMARGGWSTDVTMRQVYFLALKCDQRIADIKINNFFDSVAEGKNAHEMHTKMDDPLRRKRYGI